MDDIDQFFQNSHYNIIRVLLGITGLWPFYSRKRRYAMYLLLILLLGSGFIFQILGIIEVWDDSYELINAIPMLFYTLVALSKIISTMYTLPQIKILLIKMQEYCLSPKSDEETKIYNSHAEYGRKFGCAYTGFLLGHSVLYVLTSLSAKIFYTEFNKTDELSDKVPNSQIGLPHRANYIVDINTYYVPIFIHAGMCDFISTFIITVFDVLYLTVIEYCCGLFAALRYRLEIALEFNNNKLTMSKDKSYSNVVYSIRRHTESIQFVAIVESIYSLSLSIQMGLVILILSLLLYQVLNDIGNIDRILKPIAYLNGALFNVFFENWQGQKVIDSSEKVFDSAYNTEWYNMPIAARKLLIMLMMKSKTPLMLRLSKMVVLSYITFNTVLRTSSSYFMLLRSL
ncbi:odorant receptor 63a-like [Solenopsis invicta]|uniref:odorant receptor 63a-like n=1 Tax=Solenopsis invicta TaxID=13686 RepID=UPI00193D44C1|nr:odorant receptor 63a-like [Solenopsis invicta]